MHGAGLATFGRVATQFGVRYYTAVEIYGSPLRVVPIIQEHSQEYTQPKIGRKVTVFWPGPEKQL